MLLLAVAMLFVLLPACHKHDDSSVNTAEITIASPVEGQIYQGSVNIVGTLVGNEDLHGWVAHIRPKGGGADLFNAELHDHGTTLTINESWTPTVSVQTEVELEIIVQLDHDDTQTATKKINFIVKP